MRANILYSLLSNRTFKFYNNDRDKVINNIKELLTRVMSKLESIEQKVNYLYENNSPVFAAVLEDEKED